MCWPVDPWYWFHIVDSTCLALVKMASGVYCSAWAVWLENRACRYALSFRKLINSPHYHTINGCWQRDWTQTSSRWTRTWSQVGPWMTQMCAQVYVEDARLHIHAQQWAELRFAFGTNRFQSILQFMNMSQNMLIIACEPVPQQSKITPPPTWKRCAGHMQTLYALVKATGEFQDFLEPSNKSRVDIVSILFGVCLIFWRPPPLLMLRTCNGCVSE